MQSDCQEIARGLEVASRLLPKRGMTVWPFVTLVVAAPAFGAPLARVREMPVRRTYEPALYVTVTHTLSRYFGIVGAAIEVGAVVGALIWAFGSARSRT